MAKNHKGGMLMTKIWETLQGNFQLYLSSLMEGWLGPEVRSESIDTADRPMLRI